MAKNAIICCDGAGNQLKKYSNVVELYTLQKMINQQIAFYDPGVWTSDPLGEKKDSV